MNKEILTIEDCLEVLAGMHQAPKFEIVKEDYTILTSIARQCFKGTALTDRQFALMQEKLQTYKQQFEENEYTNFDLAVETLRQPLRHIDRSKYIKTVSHDEMVGDNVYESYKSNWQWIKVRFPFSKKLIVSLQEIKHGSNEYYHEKGSHEHFFYFNERNVYNVLSTFKDKNFDIDQTLLDYFDKVKLFENKKVYAPGIVDFEFNNVHATAQKAAIEDLGTPSQDNIIRYRDRYKLYGIHYFDKHLDIQLDKISVLTQKIATRKTSKIFVNEERWTFDNVVSSLLELDRFPLVILLDENDPYNDLVKSHNKFKNLFLSNEISVQFRLNADKNNGFNEYIKDHELNTPVDKNTKIVYTSIDKLNKPLFTSNCNPKTVMLLESRRTGMKINAWLNEFDLVIHYDTSISQFMRFHREILTEV